MEFKQAVGKKELVAKVVDELRRLAGYVEALAVGLERDSFENTPLLHPLRWQVKSSGSQVSKYGTRRGGNFDCAGANGIVFRGDAPPVVSDAKYELLSLPRVAAMDYACGVPGFTFYFDLMLLLFVCL